MENYTKIQVECNNEGYGITHCPYLHKDMVLVGGYFCGYCCKYHKGRNRRLKQVYCSHPVVLPYYEEQEKIKPYGWE